MPHHITHDITLPQCISPMGTITAPLAYVISLLLRCVLLQRSRPLLLLLQRSLPLLLMLQRSQPLRASCCSGLNRLLLLLQRSLPLVASCCSGLYRFCFCCSVFNRFLLVLLFPEYLCIADFSAACSPPSSWARSPVAMVRKTWFFVQGCPAGHECSVQSRKKAAMWGETEEAARDACKVHLMRSGSHSYSEDDAQNLSDSAEVNTYEGDDAEFDQQPEPNRERSPRRGKGEHGFGKAAWKGHLVQQTVQETLQALASSSSDLSLIRPSSTRASATGSMPIRVVQLQEAIDAVSRAATAAKQAQRISASAARAFADEAAALDSCKTTLEAVLSSM